jgi:hypothetical protein
MLVGVVLAEGCIPGQTCTASLVPNPDEVTGTPGVVVKKVDVPERRNGRGHATLDGIVVASNNASRQPGDGPITFTAPEPGVPLNLEVTPTDTPDEVESVPIEDLPRSHRTPTEEASAPPVLPDNGVCVVHDKFSGNGHATKVKINDTDVHVLTESPDLMAFRPGKAAKAGENQYAVTDNGVTKTYSLTSPSVSINASQTTLEENQSTQFQVTVSDVTGIPEGSWQSAGTGAYGAATKGGGAVPMGGRGHLLLTIKNDSPNTTTITGGNQITVPIYESDVSDGRYTYNGTITAQQPGPFQIEATIEAQLAEAPPTGVAHEGGIARGAAVACCQYDNPASGRWCTIETRFDCETWGGTWGGPPARRAGSVSRPWPLIASAVAT